MKFRRRYNEDFNLYQPARAEGHGFYFITINEFLFQQQEARMKEINHRRK
jgi:hypothetical protein